MKKFITGLIIGFILASGVAVGAATGILFDITPIEMYVNGGKVDTQLYMYGGMVYLQASKAAEAFGFDRTFDGKKLSYTRKLTDLETVAKKCKDSCVMIYAYGAKTFQGSGFVYNGYIVTAKHVIEGATKIDVFLDDSLYGVPGTVHYIDPKLDVAIIKADIDLPSVTLGDSDKLIEGEKLVSITSPNRHLNAIDECIYNGPYEDETGKSMYVSESGTDGGSSGGAIFNANGEIVAMLVAGAAEIDEGIPINDLKHLLSK